MLSKIIVIFLLAMVVLAFFGKLRFPGQARLNAARCPRCHRYRIGKGPCSCGHSDKA